MIIIIIIEQNRLDQNRTEYGGEHRQAFWPVDASAGPLDRRNFPEFPRGGISFSKGFPLKRDFP